MKKVLIVGANSYVGTSFENYINENYDNFKIDKVGAKNDEWRDKTFEGYDSVLHVAGIAHVSTKKSMASLYYKVNRDLTIEVAKKAKEHGVKQFIFTSSIIVYGDCKETNGVISKDTIPKPKNFYGKSKLEAEEGIKKLESSDFKIVILRPPMIYGPNSKGNFQKLVKLAKITPIFPDYDNKRSMLFIDNLSEFIRLIIENEESGLFFPQNKEYVRTSELVRVIAKKEEKTIKEIKLLNPIITVLKYKLEVINKVFGDLLYDKECSAVDERLAYISFEETIRQIELKR